MLVLSAVVFVEVMVGSGGGGLQGCYLPRKIPVVYHGSRLVMSAGDEDWIGAFYCVGERAQPWYSPAMWVKLSPDLLYTRVDGATPSADELAQAREIYAGEEERWGNAELAQVIRENRGPVAVPRPMGFVVTGLLLAPLGLLVYACTGIPAGIRAERARRWEAAGRCGGCGYRRVGLGAGAVCPECGRGGAGVDRT